MSMILQNLNTSSTSTPAAKVSGNAGTTGTGFNQTLSYAMNATGGTATAATAGNAAAATASASGGQSLSGLMGSAASLLEMLQALISGDQQVDDQQGDGKSVQKVDKLMDDLLKKLQEMDSSIMNDPALMQSLQAWLVQVQQVLNGGSAEQGTTTTDADGQGNQPTAQSVAAALPALAQQADTIRFAVADAVSQIVDKLQGVQNGTQQADPKLEQLLNNLQNVLQQAGNSSSTSSDSGQSNQQNQAPVQIVVKNETKAAEATATVAAAQETAEPEVANATPTNQQQQPVIVTAGQLAMRAEATPLTSTQTPAASVNVNAFPEEMSKFIVSKMDIHQLNGVSEARIIMNPENLGQVDVKISIQDGQVMAQFITEKHGAKDALEQQMAQLRTALQSQGLQVDKLEVAQSSSLFSDMYNGGQGFQSNAGQQQSGRRSKSKDEQSDDAMLTAEISNELKEWRGEQQASSTTAGVASMLNYGSTYVAKA
ncbi:flagellar hook-length control protein FliK [Paenibacillus kandeliae]|uniref:flagellar hook-length control protein FliK n=1 Tax=Paenibacillus kandeliae TaxID=3231269 RepID=UPI00345A3A1A